MEYTIQRMLSLFDSDASRSAVLTAERSGHLPVPGRKATGSTSRRYWTVDSLPKLGKRYGFISSPSEPICVCIFSAKGGVFKSSLALNIGRMAALNGIHTCVVGLDFQADISRALGLLPEDDEMSTVEETIRRIASIVGLAHVFESNLSVDDVITETDIPTLKAIPENGSLVSLERQISISNNREHIFRDRIMPMLKDRFELILFDCSPNWNQLINNAISACDVLISPVECRIAQFYNLNIFRGMLDQFRKEIGVAPQHIYVPTRYSPTRRMSVDILDWYNTSLPNVTKASIRESSTGEEAFARGLSIPEMDPRSRYANEVRDLLRELWSRFADKQQVRMSA